MKTKVICFSDIANNYSRMSYGSNKKGQTKLFVQSKFGDYLRVWNKDDEVISTTFKSPDGFILVDND